MSLNRLSNNLVFVFFLTLGCIVLTACQMQSSEHLNNQGELEISVSYRDRSMLPPDSVLTITLEDVSIMDIAAPVISTAKTALHTAQPFKVTLPYSVDMIKPGLSYNVRAQIHAQDKLIYTSSTLLDPFKQNDAAVLNIEVERVKELKLNTPLTNTYWKVMLIGKKAVINDENSQELFLQLRSENRVKGFSGCNSFMGSYQNSEHALTFSQLASTRKMCQNTMAQESAFLNVLSQTTSYSIIGDDLQLLNQQQQPLASFKAVYFN